MVIDRILAMLNIGGRSTRYRDAMACAEAGRGDKCFNCANVHACDYYDNSLKVVEFTGRDRYL